MIEDYENGGGGGVDPISQSKFFQISFSNSNFGKISFPAAVFFCQNYSQSQSSNPSFHFQSCQNVPSTGNFAFYRQSCATHFIMEFLRNLLEDSKTEPLLLPSSVMLPPTTNHFDRAAFDPFRALMTEWKDTFRTRIIVQSP